MDIHNLATVMTPNILYPNAKTSAVDESFLAIEAVNALITYNDTMCEVCWPTLLWKICLLISMYRFPRTFSRSLVTVPYSRETQKLLQKKY